MRPRTWRRDALLLAVLWLGGFNLRVTLLAVPPAIPAIHRDLGLDEKGISVLTGLPVLLLALAAVPGSLLIARLGPRRALVAGLVAVALGSAARGIGPSLAVLFAASSGVSSTTIINKQAMHQIARPSTLARSSARTAVTAQLTPGPPNDPLPRQHAGISVLSRRGEPSRSTLQLGRQLVAMSVDLFIA